MQNEFSPSQICSLKTKEPCWHVAVLVQKGSNCFFNSNSQTSFSYWTASSLRKHTAGEEHASPQEQHMLK